MNSRVQRSAAFSVVGLAWGVIAFGGPLDPPDGPVSSTYKTLSEVEPRTAINSTNTPGDGTAVFIISQPGSYYLVGDVKAVGKHGIRITTNNVSIDFRGFTLGGAPGPYFGVHQPSPSSLENIELRNGTIRDFGMPGVELPTTTGLVLSNMRILANNSHGVDAGERTLVRDCVFGKNNGDGLHATQADVISCIADGNGQNGFSMGAGSVVANCASRLNLGKGFIVGDGTTVSACSAANNGVAGFVGAAFATFTGCTSSNNGLGFEATTYCTMQACSATNNAGLGVNVATGAHIQGCDVSSNDGAGIVMSDGGSVRDCTARFNTGDGIRVSTDCQVVGNTTDGNGPGVGDGAGIHATGGGNRIERNSASDNDRGIDVDLCSNVIICNFAFGNAGFQNFVVTCPSGSQWFGPVVPPGTPLSTNPYANFGELAP